VRPHRPLGRAKKGTRGLGISNTRGKKDILQKFLRQILVPRFPIVEKGKRWVRKKRIEKIRRTVLVKKETYWAGGEKRTGVLWWWDIKDSRLAYITPFRQGGFMECSRASQV